MNKKLILTVIGLSVVLVGCQSPNVSNNQDNNPDTVIENANENPNPSKDRVDEDKGLVSTDLKLIEASDITNEDLQQIFKDEFPGGEITSIAIDNEDREIYFDVEGIEDGKEVQVKVDVLTKEVIKSEKDNDVEDDLDQVINFEGIKDWKEAIQAAMDAEMTDDFKDLELKVKDGKAVYEIELPNVNGDVIVDAQSLEIMK